MRATLHISLLAATLSPSLVHSSPIPFAQNYNSSPRSSAQAISESSRPGGAFSSRTLLTRGGSHGLGLFNLGSNNGGNGGDASSGSSFAYGGEDHHDKEDDHSAGGGGAPVIDLGPITPASDQPEQPPHTGNDADPKPVAHTPGEPASLPPEPDTGIDHNLDDGGNKPPDGGTPVNPNDTTPPPGPAPDPAAGNSTPDIPIFLGPSGKDPSHGGSSPPYDAPKASGYPGDGGGHKYTDDSPCDGPFGGSLINLLSNNGGNGGDASSGAATSVGYGGKGSTSAYSGAGGYAAGGSVKAAPALINILSDNGGDGGDAESGDSYSYSAGKRRGSASYSGPGGNASGGSVENLCSRHHEASRSPADSETSKNAFTRSRSGASLFALRKTLDDTPAAHSGMGGDASGGSTKEEPGLINIWSGNGGDGGDASSGFAYAYGPGATAYSGPGGNAAGGDVYRRAPVNIRTAAGEYPASENDARRHDYKGVDVVNAWSGNGGDGGDARSGSAYAFGYGASAHSGAGGNASGGSVTGRRHDKPVKGGGDDGGHSGAEAYSGAGGDASGGDVEGGDGLINLSSGNGGDGGDASSGSAVAYGKGAKAYSGPGGDASGGSVNAEKDKKPSYYGKGYGYGHRWSSIADVASGNGGDGGDASSGDAVAVSDG